MRRNAWWREENIVLFGVEMRSEKLLQINEKAILNERYNVLQNIYFIIHCLVLWQRYEHLVASKLFAFFFQNGIIVRMYEKKTCVCKKKLKKKRKIMVLKQNKKRNFMWKACSVNVCSLYTWISLSVACSVINFLYVQPRPMWIFMF